MITERQRETLIEDTVNKIMIGQIVPIIGDDVFNIKDEGDHEMKLHDYVVFRLIKRSRIKNIDYEKACKGFKGMTYLKKIFKDEYLNLNNEILKLYREEKIIERAYLSEEIHEFLTKRKFPLIITTSYSNILEKILGTEYRSAYYMKQKKNAGRYSVLQDIGMVNENDEYNRLAEPTVYHILGNISTGYDCALTENEFLQFLHHLHDTNSRPEKLRGYINNQRYILALGCNIPDWTLRFLLYSFDSDINKREGMTFNGGVIDTKTDENLEEFLLNIDYYYEDVNQKRFISGINSKLQPEKEREKVFVSVMQSDLKDPIYGNIIYEIVDVLKEKFDVWFCEDNLKGLAGEPYWDEIRRGLETCDRFYPILSYRLLKQFKGDISLEPRPDIEQGIITEWKYAFDVWANREFKKDFVKPIKIGLDLDDIKDVFLLNNSSEIIKRLRQLVFGKDLEGGQRTGSQIVDYMDINKIDL